MARGPCGTEPAVAAARRTFPCAYHRLRPLHRLPPGPFLVPPKDGRGPRRSGGHDLPAGTGGLLDETACASGRRPAGGGAPAQRLLAGAAGGTTGRSDTYGKYWESPEEPPRTILPKTFSLPYAQTRPGTPHLPDGMQWTICSLLYEGLFRLTPSLEVQTQLCSQWSCSRTP